MTEKRGFLTSGCFLLAFVVWTSLLFFVDVQPIGVCGSSVGFATLNSFVHGLTGTNMLLYIITDWLGLVPIAVAFFFGVLGLIQWIRRKSFRRVDRDILLLGGFYVLVMAVYLLFEFVVINYRPVLINGYPEVSYPSSTTMLVTCVMPTTLMQWNVRVRCRLLRRIGACVILLFAAFMVAGRALSGVHWISDIVGGALFSVSAVLLYKSAISTFCKK